MLGCRCHGSIGLCRRCYGSRNRRRCRQVNSLLDLGGFCRLIGRFGRCALGGGFRLAAGRFFHCGARSPVHFCRGRRIAAAGHQRIIGRHEFVALTSLGGSGFVLRGLRRGKSRCLRFFRRGFGHIQPGALRCFRGSIADLLQGRFGHKLALLKIGAHTQIPRGPFHTNNAELLVVISLPVQTAHAFSGKIGCRIELL